MHNGLIASSSSSLHPIKYLHDFSPYVSFLETNVLLMSMSSALNGFLFL